MRQRTYTLPRHTNLGSQGLRFVAAVADFAITLGLTLAFLYGVFQFVFSSSLGIYDKQLTKYKCDSHLFNRKGEVAEVVEDKIEAYEDALPKFYLSYLAGKPLEDEEVAPNSKSTIIINDKETTPREYYTVEFYNREILGINLTNPDNEKSTLLFTYQKDNEGNYLKDRIGVRRESHYNENTAKQEKISDDDIIVYYRSQYVTAVHYLSKQGFYRNASDHYYFILQCELAISMSLAGIISYVIIPLFLKRGQTLGKKIFKLGLASYDGFTFSNYQLFLRIIPYLITSASLLLPIWTSLALSLGVFITIVLISFALMMASPKKCALHDFAARTIVVDLESSILFNNELEEEIYIRKEDGLPSLEEEQNGSDAY